MTRFPVTYIFSQISNGDFLGGCVQDAVRRSPGKQCRGHLVILPQFSCPSGVYAFLNVGMNVLCTTYEVKNKLK